MSAINPASGRSAGEVVAGFLQRQRAMYRGGDAAPVEELLAEDVVWHVPGTSPIAGDHRGRAGVMRYFARRRELAGGSLEIVERGQVEAGNLVVQLADGRGIIGGRSSEWRTAGVYRVENGLLAEAWLVPGDLAAFDAIWGGPRPAARDGRGRALRDPPRL
jgi:ketosteroid isomerase-like protein